MNIKEEIMMKLVGREKEIERLTEEINKLELKQQPFIGKRDELRKQIALEKGKKMFGKFFKYRNSYGSSSQGWWLYTKIIDVNETGLKLLDIEKEGNGLIRINIQQNYGYDISQNYQEISEKEWLKGVNSILKQLADETGMELKWK